VRKIVNPNIDPARGEIWEVALDPVVGMEINAHDATRPCIILTPDPFRSIRLRAIVPITEWKEHLARQAWAIPLEPDANNGLDKRSLALANQVRTTSLDRFFTEKAEALFRGRVTADQLEAVTLAVGLMIGHP